MEMEAVRTMVRSAQGRRSFNHWCILNGVGRGPAMLFMNGRRDRPPKDLLKVLGLEWRLMPVQRQAVVERCA